MVFSPLIATTPTFAWNARLWFRRGRRFMVLSSLAASCRCCSENPLTRLFRFPQPHLWASCIAFTAADGPDSDPHDYPFAADIVIMFGGYVEHVFDLEQPYDPTLEVECREGDQADALVEPIPQRLVEIDAIVLVGQPAAQHVLDQLVEGVVSPVMRRADDDLATSHEEGQRRLQEFGQAFDERGLVGDDHALLAPATYAAPS